VIIALGATATNGLLGYDTPCLMKNIRGEWFEFHGTPLMVTFHPSYLLRNGTNVAKRVVWEDMLAVMEKIGMPISEKQRNFFL
jgi:DNA polymerase